MICLMKKEDNNKYEYFLYLFEIKVIKKMNIINIEKNCLVTKQS